MSEQLSSHAAVIGGGPAGLMAAEMLATGGVAVDLYDSMPSAGRKFLMAGKGGLNITHSDARGLFLSRYGARAEFIAPHMAEFDPEALRAWMKDLGIDSFVGTSGRVFPNEMKAAPLLRAWLHRLRAAGMRFHMRHRWLGFAKEGDRFVLRFGTPEGEKIERADAVVLALGGGSWPRLGSDGGWVPLLAKAGIAVAPLRAANSGFDVAWSEHFRARFAGHPVKPVVARFTDMDGAVHREQGEFVVTENGVEGGLIYALSALLRDGIARDGTTVLHLDLAPSREEARLADALTRPRGKESLANTLRKRAGIEGAKAGLLRELAPDAMGEPARLARAIKNLPLTLLAPRPLKEAISSAGGVAFEALDERLMARTVPGLFCAGEMLDWEAPTGGYLLTACFSTGRAAGLGARAWLAERQR
ncbi:MAG: NAD(P)/FAD-dependent oxidoreductase [Alphaproteobacteria bacterium]